MTELITFANAKLICAGWGRRACNTAAKLSSSCARGSRAQVRKAPRGPDLW